jgi:transcriptional regulator with XRE-family HTH domain
MSNVAGDAGIGGLLRDWRNRRRLSQLDLSLEANVSARHLSFVETGRARPSRKLVLHLAKLLDVPLRDRNTMLLAAGFAPVYPETALEEESMRPVRHALQRIVKGHEPFPAVIVDRHWNVVWSNSPAQQFLTEGVAERLLAPPVSWLRVTLHPEGLAPRILNLAELSAHLMLRLRRQAALAPDSELDRLHDEVVGYPGVNGSGELTPRPESLLVVPLEIQSRISDGPLSLFSTLATFGTAVDITLPELSIESFFPADKKTDTALRTAFADELREPLPQPSLG